MELDKSKINININNFDYDKYDQNKNLAHMQQNNQQYEKKEILVGVLGVGGAGCNCVNYIIEHKCDNMCDVLVKNHIKFVALNTDICALNQTKAEIKIQLGAMLTRGCGAGGLSQIGESAVLESKEQIEKQLEGLDLLFIVTGLGGGTGTGGAPQVARIAKDKGILVVSFAFMPFMFEGELRINNAQKGLLELEKHSDCVSVIYNNDVAKHNNNLSLVDMFDKINNSISQFIYGTLNLLSYSSLINIDFADIKTVIYQHKRVHFGIGYYKGKNSLCRAISKAIINDVCCTSLENAKSVILHITGDKNLLISDVMQICNEVTKLVSKDANIIYGATINPEYKEESKVFIIATDIMQKQYEDECKWLNIIDCSQDDNSEEDEEHNDDNDNEDENEEENDNEEYDDENEEYEED